MWYVLSSRNKIVFLPQEINRDKVIKRFGAYLPVRESVDLAASTIARTSLMPAEVALSSLNTPSLVAAINRARVVFPQLDIRGQRQALDQGKKIHPLGPHNIRDPLHPLEMRLTTDSCPTNSDKVVGRNFSANGAASCKATLVRFSGGPSRGLL